MVMATFPPALRRTGFAPPRAIRHFTEAIVQARAAEQEPQPRPAPAAPLTPVRLRTVRPRRTVVRLWLPLTLLFVLLAPFAILLSPLGWLVPRSLCARPFSGVFILGRALLALGGTTVDVDTPEARVLIRIV